MSYQEDHLCAGLKAVIDSVVHGVQSIWDEKLTTEDWGFLLVDADNAFNDINRVGMMWTFGHSWLSVDFFFFNCYHHWLSLVLRNGNGTASFLHRK